MHRTLTAAVAEAVPDGVQTAISPAAAPVGAERPLRPASNAPTAAADGCFHCGTPLRGATFAAGEKSFCCQGCLAVFEILTGNGLDDFYRIGRSAGVRVKSAAPGRELEYLNDPAVRRQLVDFQDEHTTHVTFRVPAMHCIACLWLLENLHRLEAAITHSRVNFPRKEVSIVFTNDNGTLAGVAALLASLGYEPDLKMSDLDRRAKNHAPRRLWLQLGVAGFAFGNIMLMSISSYLGLDAFSGPGLRHLFGYVSFVLAVPVILYSAADYWRAAWQAWRRRILTIEVPIAAGIAALALRSTWEVVAGQGAGYFDSLAGLVFFLLCGRLFQLKTWDRLAFDRDYKSFFPLSIARVGEGREERVALAQLHVGDRLVIRNGELIPADAQLIGGPAMIDYSFVTGESEPVTKLEGDHLYAGGRQMGGTIEIRTVKAVSQSYLNSLWNQQTFQKQKGPALETLTDRYSRWFTRAVILIAAGAAVYWTFVNPSRSLFAFTSVLIVACPCALALAAPFAFGAAQRVLARRNIFLKNPGVIETLARVDAVVFDKTGTLTATSGGSVIFDGVTLDEAEERQVHSLARHSTHPYAVRIGEATAGQYLVQPVRSFTETPGCGVEGLVDGDELWMGSAAWLAARQVTLPTPHAALGSFVHLAINGRYRGCYSLTSTLRPRLGGLMQRLAADGEVALLSGDNERERERFVELFGSARQLHFNQNPLNKLGFIQELQGSGRTVMMVGDGLNDAGALQQSDAGVAVVESIGAFSPASDVIMSAKMVPALHEVLSFSRATVRVVQVSFLISSLYNLVGIGLAARGGLSPAVCAVLMPLSSVTVVAFACGMTHWLSRRIGRATEGEVRL